MKTSLLTTKFNIPASSEKRITRSRLLDRLDEGLRQDCLLTLVCAPAGYGKTTLVGDWIKRIGNAQQTETSREIKFAHPIQFAWLTLEQGDDDLGRFLAYLVTALQQYHPEVGQGIMEAFQTTRPPAPTTAATWLINDLATMPDRMVLVLDDYHLISSQPIHNLLSYLVDHQPPQICLVIVSRADPPLPLARLRARGQLVEIRQDELNFSLAEAENFLRGVMGLDLTSQQLATLENRTEGWVAGLQLAALSMRKIQDIPAFIDAFSGGNVHIADFLADEVLSQQPGPINSFLLQTSILNRLSAPLCEAVTRQAQAQETLEKLKEENLFLVSLDHQQEWFRYHALFADLLSKRLHQTQPEMVKELHSRASQWFWENGLPEAAIGHALAGGNFEIAADLIENVGEKVLSRGEASTLLGWLEALPREQMRSHPLLSVFYGLVLIICGKPPDAAKRHLDEITTSGEMDSSVVGELAVFQGIMAMMKGNFSEAVRLSEIALGQLAPEKGFFRSLAADNLGMAYTLAGESAAATKAFETAVEISEESDNLMMILGALSNLAGILVQQGKLHAAYNSYQRILNLASERLGNRSQLTGKALLGLGSLAREWNDLDDALRYYEDALEMFKGSVEIGLPVVYLSIAMVKLNQNDLEAAQTYIDKARQYAQSTTTTKLDDRLTEETQARFWVSLGKLERVDEWVKARGYSSLVKDELMSFKDKRMSAKILADQNIYLTIARLYLAKKQVKETLEILNPLLDVLSEKDHTRRVIEALALKALALKEGGDPESALQVLQDCLALAEPEGYQRTFLNEGEPMAQLLYMGAEKGLYPAYIGKLLAAFSDEVPGTRILDRGMGSAEKLIEPLSERELEVLALIAKGLSNQQIGARLHITLSTVKTHASQIYSKLNVTNRTQAVSRARSLGIIPFV